MPRWRRSRPAAEPTRPRPSAPSRPSGAGPSAPSTPLRQRAEAADRVTAYEQAAGEWRRVPPGRPPAGVDPVAVARGRWQRTRARAQAHHDALQARPPRRTRRGGQPVPVDEQLVVRRAYAAYQAAEQAAAEQAAAQVGAQVGANADRGLTAAHDHASTDNGNRDNGNRDDRDHDDRDHTRGRRSRARRRRRPEANLTDPDSRLLKTRNGWIQGYNCQTAISDDEFILLARATQDANDSEQFTPTAAEVTAIAARLAEHTGRDTFAVGTLIGDAGYDSDANLAAQGPDRLIADAKQNIIDRRAATEPATGDPPTTASPREAMNHRLRTPHGQALYRRRSGMIEPSNAWVKDRRGLRQFSRRGLAAVQAELSLACAVVNLLKLATKGITPAHLHAR